MYEPTNVVNGSSGAVVERHQRLVETFDVGSVGLPKDATVDYFVEVPEMAPIVRGRGVAQ